MAWPLLPKVRMGRPLRLVQFTKAFHIGGTEGQVVELIRALPDDYQVSVAVLDAVGPLLGQVEALGHRAEAFPLDGSFLSASTPKQIVRLARWLKGRGADVVHAHDFYSTLLAVPAAKLAGARVVVSRLDLLHWHGRARAALLGQVTRWADHVIANAEAVKRLCLSQGVAARRISVVRNGIDLGRFDAQAGVSQRPAPSVAGAPLVVHVANMSHPVKRQEDLLRAMRIAEHHGVSFHAYFVGDGARRPQLERLARELGVADRAHFLGFRTDAPALWARATVGVLCSNKEGLSNAIIEGMAARVPMVVTRVGGNPELVAHGERGLVVEPEQPAALAAAISSLLKDPERARRMGRSGRAFVERELTLDRMVRSHDRIYRAVAMARKETRGAAGSTIETVGT